MSAEPGLETFRPGEAPFLLRKGGEKDRAVVELVQAGARRSFLLAKGQLLGFASTHPQEQLSPSASAQELLLAAAKGLGKLLEAGGQVRWQGPEPPPAQPVPLAAVILEAFRRASDLSFALDFLGPEKPFLRQGEAPPTLYQLSPLETFLWQKLATPMSLKEVQTLLPQEAQALACAFVAFACLGLLRPADPPAPKEEKPLFPPANPVLRRRLAQIAKEGGLPTGDYERVISEEELAQAQQDKQLALQILAQGGDERQAVRLLTQAVSILPDPHSLVRLAEIEVANPLLRQRALAHLKQALEMEPRFTPAWLALANYWGLRGDVGKQKRCLENILKYDPQNREVREALLHLVG